MSYAGFVSKINLGLSPWKLKQEKFIMKKIIVLVFAAMTVLSATTKAPKTSKQMPIPICYPCPEEAK